LTSGFGWLRIIGKVICLMALLIKIKKQVQFKKNLPEYFETNC